MVAPNTDTFNFTTGPATVPDVGVCIYNGCTFSSLFESKIRGKVVKDNANRTTKLMEYTLEIDGYVTLPDRASDIAPTMQTLRNLLTAQGGKLIYRGRGFDLVINAGAGGGGPPVPGAILIGPGGGGGAAGGGNAGPGGLSGLDVAWGPIPELLEFQPLGAGRSAKVQWSVVVRIPEVKRRGKGLLQLNYESSVSYAEDGYSSLSVRGTLEVPQTRLSQDTRNVLYTADDYRVLLEDRILKGIDLDLFRVTRRDFDVSRDKRTLEWTVEAEERPYMDLPPDCPVARGTYSVRPAKVGMGLVAWLCTLKATYNVRVGQWRRVAWLSFLALMRLRMNQAPRGGDLPNIPSDQQPARPGPLEVVFDIARGDGVAVVRDIIRATAPGKAGIAAVNRRVWLLDFSVEEGVYLDSKTTTFSATWRLLCKFSHILLASGIWRKLPEKYTDGENLWAASMRSIQGTKSWLPNQLDPALDVIVDFGGPDTL